MPRLFDSYDDLQDSAQRRLNRSTTLGFPEWIREVEDWMSGGMELGLGSKTFQAPALRIQAMEENVTYEEIPEDGLPQPDDYLDLRDIRGQFEAETQELIYQALATFEDIALRGEARPVFTQRGVNFQLSPGITPPISLQYYRKIPPLRPETSYADHPIASINDSCYLHGALAAAMIQYRNMERASVELGFYKAAIVRLNSQAQRSREGEAPMRSVIVGGVP